jgi:hypothetical protein
VTKTKEKKLIAMISTWTELITYYLFTNSLPVKDFNPDICVINFVSLLKIRNRCDEVSSRFQNGK